MDQPSRATAPPREPGPAARVFVYGFAALSPVLTLALLVVPVAVAVHVPGGRGVALGAWSFAACAGLLALGVRRVRRLGSRFSPPLALPGDIWGIGTPEPPRRSANWPIRLFRRRPDGGSALRRVA